MGFLSKLAGSIAGAVWTAQGNEDLKESGVEGTATILDLKPTERELFLVHARIKLPGRDPFEVTHETTQEPAVGTDVRCFVDQSKEQRVHYDVGIAPA